jgi:hypothetical protein
MQRTGDGVRGERASRPLPTGVSPGKFAACSKLNGTASFSFSAIHVVSRKPPPGETPVGSRQDARSPRRRQPASINVAWHRQECLYRLRQIGLLVAVELFHETTGRACARPVSLPPNTFRLAAFRTFRDPAAPAYRVPETAACLEPAPSSYGGRSSSDA